VLLDTPGLRGLALWESGEGLQRAFADVAEAADGCRFRDCRHEGEPGCAVREALDAGELDPERYRNYRKMQAEMRHAATLVDQRKAQDEKSRVKRVHRDLKKVYKKKSEQ
jgi:ribosome biogenesis GTPase